MMNVSLRSDLQPGALDAMRVQRKLPHPQPPEPRQPHQPQPHGPDISEDDPGTHGDDPGPDDDD
jgi:hypothetical protein